MMTKEECVVGATVRGKWDDRCYWEGVVASLSGNTFFIDLFEKYHDDGRVYGTPYKNYSASRIGGSKDNFCVVKPGKKVKKIKSWTLS
jgi:hypothetical protein